MFLCVYLGTVCVLGASDFSLLFLLMTLAEQTWHGNYYILQQLHEVWKMSVSSMATILRDKPSAGGQAPGYSFLSGKEQSHIQHDSIRWIIRKM